MIDTERGWWRDPAVTAAARAQLTTEGVLVAEPAPSGHPDMSGLRFTDAIDATTRAVVARMGRDRWRMSATLWPRVHYTAADGVRSLTVFLDPDADQPRITHAITNDGQDLSAKDLIGWL